MNTGIEEKVYLRKALNGAKITSSQIAQSYLDGRLGETELFSINGRKLRFMEVFLEDELVRDAVLAVKSVEEVLHPASKDNKKQQIDFDDETTWGLLNLEISELRKEKERLLKNCQKAKEQTLSCQNRNDALVAACSQAEQTLHEFNAIINAQKKALPPDSEVFSKYDGILLITGILAKTLGEKLRKNKSAADSNTVPLSQNVLEQINTIEDFRKTTESVLAKKKAESDASIEEYRKTTESVLARKKAESDASIAAGKQELFLSQQSTKKQIQDELDKLDAFKKKEYQAIEDTRIIRNNELLKLKEESLREITDHLDKLALEMSVAGRFENRIRTTVQKSLGKLSLASERCFLSTTAIPEKVLYNAIKAIGGKVAPNSVLAIYDCSLAKNGTAGIMISSHAFYLFDKDNMKRYILHRNNRIEHELKTSDNNNLKFLVIVFGAFFGTILFACEQKALGILLFIIMCILATVFDFKKHLIFRNNYKGEPIFSFSHGDIDELKQFCDGVNEVCQSCSMTGDQIAAFEKIMS